MIVFPSFFRVSLQYGSDSIQHDIDAHHCDPMQMNRIGVGIERSTELCVGIVLMIANVATKTPGNDNIQ